MEPRRSDHLLRVLQTAVAQAPTSAHARSDLARALIANESLAEAFEHLGVAFQLGLDDRLDAMPIRRLLLDMAAVLTETHAGSGQPTVDDADTSWPGSRETASAAREGDVQGHVHDPALVGADGDQAGVMPEFSRPSVTLADVAGLDDVKSHLEVKMFAPLRNPELAARFGKIPTGGLLMWGAPGCGKTFVARALAGSLDVGFSSVGMDEVLDMWIGSSERNLASVFASARQHAPVALFFDEVDAIGGRRSRMGAHATMRSVVTMLLTELDGATRDNSGVFTIAATNLPWDVDPALRRPGRFDRTVFVPPPDQAARVGILANRLSSIPIGNNLQLGRIADITAGFSGADVSAIVDIAVDEAFTTSLRTGAEVAVDQSILERAATSASSSIQDWIQTATTAAEASNDVELYGPFLKWLDRRDRDR